MGIVTLQGLHGEQETPGNCGYCHASRIAWGAGDPRELWVLSRFKDWLAEER